MIRIRPLAPTDSLATLTTLLNRAYAPLAARGMDSTAAAQDETTIRDQVNRGACYVAEREGRLVGMITACAPRDPAKSPWAAQVPALVDPGSAT
jgi:hypothetical protein